MQDRPGSTIRPCLLLAALGATELVAQSSRVPATRLTPDPEILARLEFREGVAFTLGTIGESSAIDELLARPLRWLETPHFRIGADLALLTPREVGTARRTEIDREAKALGGEKLATQWRRHGVDGAWRHVSLALHLERVWGELERFLPPIQDGTPPTGPAQDLEGRGVGCGPHFGRDAKFVVLVFAEEADHRRFCVDFLAEDSRVSRRVDLGATDGLAFSTAEAMVAGADRDRALRAHVTFGVVANVIDGYRGANQPAPAWLRFGLAQSFALAIDPTANNAEAVDRAIARDRDPKSWWEILRRMRRDDSLEPGARFAIDLDRPDLAAVKREDLVRIWSYVEFLRQRDSAALGRFLFEQKARVAADFSKSVPAALRERQNENLSRILGFADAAAFEVAWESWRVRRTP